jgi:hypothetical protein
MKFLLTSIDKMQNQYIEKNNQSRIRLKTQINQLLENYKIVVFLIR